MSLLSLVWFGLTYGALRREPKAEGNQTAWSLNTVPKASSVEALLAVNETKKKTTRRKSSHQVYPANTLNNA